MFRKVDDFLKAYDSNVERTTKVLGALDDAALGQAMADGYRTSGEIAWHIVRTGPTRPCSRRTTCTASRGPGASRS